MEPTIIIPPQPPQAKITSMQIVAWAAGMLMTSLGTLTATRMSPAPVPAVAPAATNTPTQVPAQAAPVSPVATLPAAPTVLRVDTLRIEAGKVELVGNVTVNIPEIKLPASPDVIVENKLPPEVIAALLKTPPEPQVYVENKIDSSTLTFTDLKEPAKLPTPVPARRAEVLHPPTPPVRVWPKEKE